VTARIAQLLMTGWLVVAPTMTSAQARDPAPETPPPTTEQGPQGTLGTGKAPPPDLVPPAEDGDEHLRLDEPVSFPVDI
jgi:hypothetical protein